MVADNSPVPSKKQSHWEIESSLAPEGKMHLIEVAVLSVVLVSIGVLFSYAMQGAAQCGREALMKVLSLLGG